jgi:protein O-GlcNAcase/histone acetyltransferase
MHQNEFLIGVVEGFYGKPWRRSERLDLFAQLGSLGLNTYFYAPKNDLKHRSLWRECYSDAELALMHELVQACNGHGLNFIYGLSPGLDICFSDNSERRRIERRFEQLQGIGVRSFALLFDDLPGQMSDRDLRAYGSVAAAQCDVTNAIHLSCRERDKGGRFLFCPTPYCDRMDRARLGGEGYLDEIGQRLFEGVDVLWTGPDIVSAEIPIGSIERLSQRIGRQPVIWDNLFANDYDFHRLHCGPYSGRKPELRGAVRGILINPNNEYPINFIPLHTLAAYAKCDAVWQPRDAYMNAASRWLEQFETTSASIAHDDLVLLADCFYLPQEDGSEARRLETIVERMFREPVDSWRALYAEFSVLNSRIQQVFERLTELRDRDLFNAWSRHAWQLKESLLLIDTALAQKKAGRDIAAGIDLENQMPQTFRGGILPRLERIFCTDLRGKMWANIRL